MESSAILDLIAVLDDGMDLEIPHLIVTATGAIISFWVMMCMTPHFGIRSQVGRWALFLRLALVILSIVFASRFAQSIYTETSPWLLDLALEVAAVFVLLTIPIALRRSPTP